MAFTTTQTLDSVLMHNLLFRNTANAPISSMYTLYANGRGQTFWGPSLGATSISSLSTAIGAQYVPVKSELSTLTHAFTDFSTVTFPSALTPLQEGVLSSVSYTQRTSNVLRNDFVVMSNSLTANFNTLSNNLTIQVNSIYTSSLDIVASTLQSISSISTFTNEIAAVQTSTYGLHSVTQLAISTLSTALGIQASDNYISLSTTSSDLFISSIRYTDYSVQSTFSKLQAQISSFQFSSISSLSWLAYNINTLNAETGSLFVSTHSITSRFNDFSTVNAVEIGVLDTRISTIEFLGTQISTFVIESLSTYLFYPFSTIFGGLGTLTSSLTSTLTQNFADVYTTIYTTNAAQDYVIGTHDARISTLEREFSTLNQNFSTLTTSSILANVYDTFQQLEDYSLSVLNNTLSTSQQFLSTLYVSTILQTESTTTGYLNENIDDIYISTINYVQPSTIAYTSSLISTLYYYGTSTINSTFTKALSDYISTTSSLTNVIILSTTAYLNSSIVGYVQGPGNAALSSFSTNAGVALNSFSTLGLSRLIQQSTLFQIALSTNQSTLNSVISTGTGWNSTMSTSYFIYNSTFSWLFGSFRQSTISTFTAQNVQFASSIVSYNAGYSTFVQSTITQTNSTINQYISTIQNSTLSIVNNYISTINQSIRAEDAFVLTGTNFQAMMNFSTTTNFHISVQSPLLNGSNNYRITYQSNSVANLNNYRGLITVDVSTVTSGYSNNNGRLCLDTYRWGLPTTIFNEFYPLISSADYTMVYEYNIRNSIVYTNLLNVYPRLRVFALAIGAGTGNNVFVGGQPQTGIYWRGTPITVEWKNYSHFPIGLVGAPAFNAEILVDVLYSNQLQGRLGPYPLSVSSATVVLPYISSIQTIPMSTVIRSYIVGNPMNASELSVNVLVPQISTFQIAPAPNKFIALQQIQALDTTGTNALSLTLNPTVAMTGVAGGNNLAFDGNTTFYGRGNALDSDPTSITIGPVNQNNPDNTARYTLGIPTTSISSIVLQNISASSNVTRSPAAGINDAQEMQGATLTIACPINNVLYTSTLNLTSSAIQVFRV